jgi:hypothetical protein
MVREQDREPSDVHTAFLQSGQKSQEGGEEEHGETIVEQHETVLSGMTENTSLWTNYMSEVRRAQLWPMQARQHKRKIQSHRDRPLRTAFQHPASDKPASRHSSCRFICLITIWVHYCRGAGIVKWYVTSCPSVILSSRAGLNLRRTVCESGARPGRQGRWHRPAAGYRTRGLRIHPAHAGRRSHRH